MQQNPLMMLLLGLATGATGGIGEDLRQAAAARCDSASCNPNVVVVPLVAGRRKVIGEIEVSLDGNRLHVHIKPDGGWQLTQTHVALGETLADIPTSKAGCPKIGRFTAIECFDPPVDEHDVILDLAALGLAEAKQLVIAAHAEVESWLDDHEGAWGQGSRFPCCPSTATHFTVDLRELQGLILWNTLSSVEDVTHSEVGPNGIIVGQISFAPGHEGNGFRPEARVGDPYLPDNYIDFPGLQLGPRGSLEFWYRPDWANSAVGHVVDILSYGVVDDVFNQHITVQFNDWQNRFLTAVFEAGTTAGVAVGESAPIFGWSTSESFHVALTWDGDAPRVSDRFRVFLNGVALPETSFHGDPNLAGWLPNAVLRLGGRLLAGDWERHAWEGLDGVMNDIKIWNYPKVSVTELPIAG